MRHRTSSGPFLAHCKASNPRGHAVRANSGFTLMELLITIAVGAILVTLAVPAFQNFLRNDRQWTTANSLVMSLNAARSEAIKQDTAVSVCPTANGTSCSASSAWSQGWIVLSSASGSTPALTVPTLATGSTLTEASGLTAVTFLSTGMVSAQAAFTLCDARGATQARYVQVGPTGSIASSSTVGQALSGAPLSCP